jgi:hypothetical protein
LFCSNELDDCLLNRRNGRGHDNGKNSEDQRLACPLRSHGAGTPW